MIWSTPLINIGKPRVSRIDVDNAPSRRQEIIDYVASMENTYKNFYFSEIVTFQTLQAKAAIKLAFKPFGYSEDECNGITRDIDDKKKERFEKQWKDLHERYPEPMWFADRLRGVIHAIGSHPSGFVVAPLPIDENMGTIYTKDSSRRVSAINMKDIDGLNWIKLDILGLSSIELTNEVCRMAGIERLTPDNVDDQDEAVWNSMLESTLSCFQWESDTAFSYYKKLFNPNTVSLLRQKIGDDLTYMNLFSIGNAAIRPSGDSYRDALASGVTVDYGHQALNDFLAPTASRMIFQEQIIEFLKEFCGYSGGDSDRVRRAIGKKSQKDLEIYIPQIKERFIETMTTKHGVTKERAEELIVSFLQVIDDASNYGFSINHSHAYSYIGYVNAYLRYYYPLEFAAVQLQILATEAKDGYLEKSAEVIAYVSKRGVTLSPPKFGYAKTKYSVDKSTNTIFKDTKSIKGVETVAGDNLYTLKDNNYEYFVDLLIDVEENGLCNKTSLVNLIKLNFFDVYGQNMKLLDVYEEFKNGKSKYDKKHVEKTKIKRRELLREFESKVIDRSLPLREQIVTELELLGYVQTLPKSTDKTLLLVVNIDTKYSPKLSVIRIADGATTVMKVSKQIFYQQGGKPRIQVGDIVRMVMSTRKPKSKMVDGKWVKQTEKELWLTQFEVANHEVQ